MLSRFGVPLKGLLIALSDAILGGRWNDDDTAKANFNSVSTYHHGEASEMFFEKKFLENKMSASDLLVSELKKVIK
ncbi:TPA: hypothetical protein VAM18_001359 [Acinetobacter baumannii]|nr:hypothetical protein [Acinetobacter baumannii]